VKTYYIDNGRYKLYQAPIAVPPGKEWRVGFKDDGHTIHHVIAIAKKRSEAIEKLRAHRNTPKRRKRTKKTKHSMRRRKDGPTGFAPGHVNIAINALLGHGWVIQDSWIRFDEGVLMRDGDFYRVIDNDGNRYKGARHPRKAIELWKEGERAPADRPQPHQLWVSRKQPNRGLELIRVRSHGHPLTGGAYIVGRVVLFDTARRRWTPVFLDTPQGSRARKVRATPDELQRQYRRELDPTRSST
jgi:hypothetical protein